MKDHIGTSDERQAILNGLANAPAVLEGLVKSIPEDRLHLRRGKDSWTIAEHVAHLAEVQAMLVGRIARILNEDTPEFVPFFPDEEGEAPPLPHMDEALASFARGRSEQLDLLEGAGPDAWQRTAVHPEYESYSIAILARHILMHDHWHMYRMEELWLTREEYLARG